MPASRRRVRGRTTARAGGPAERAATVTPAGIRCFLRISGIATAAASAAAATPFTSGRQGELRVDALPVRNKAGASLMGSPELGESKAG